MEHYGWCVGALWVVCGSIMGGVWEHYGWCVGELWVVCGSIMGGVWEHYGWCVGALWVVCGSIRERNYRLKKKDLFIWAYCWGRPHGYTAARIAKDTMGARRTQSSYHSMTSSRIEPSGLAHTVMVIKHHNDPMEEWQATY